MVHVGAAAGSGCFSAHSCKVRAQRMHSMRPASCTHAVSKRQPSAPFKRPMQTKGSNFLLKQAALARSGQRDHRRVTGLLLFHLILSSAVLAMLPRQKFKRSFPSQFSACLFLAHTGFYNDPLSSLISRSLAENTFATSIAVRRPTEGDLRMP